MAEMGKAPKVEVEVEVDADAKRVWDAYTDPQHITQWNFASPEWHCPAATNEVEVGGAFSWRMEARDGSMGFDFSGRYRVVEPERRLVTELDDGRAVELRFIPADAGVRLVQTFEIEDENSAEMQRAGWQAILDNFKAYAEGE